MPNEIRPVDAFRRATKEVETSRNLGNGLQENYIVRDVYYDSAVAVRHIVKETVDSKGKRLSYNENEAILTLDKKADVIHFSADPTHTPGSCAKKSTGCLKFLNRTTTARR